MTIYGTEMAPTLTAGTDNAAHAVSRPVRIRSGRFSCKDIRVGGDAMTLLARENHAGGADNTGLYAIPFRDSFIGSHSVHMVADKDKSYTLMAGQGNAAVAVPFSGMHKNGHGQHVRGDGKSFTLSTWKEDACVAVPPGGRGIRPVKLAGQGNSIFSTDGNAATLMAMHRGYDNFYADAGASAAAEARRMIRAGEMRVRRLTPVECERVQGFPDGWTDVGGVPEGARYRLVGNSVMPPIVEFLGGRLA